MKIYTRTGDNGTTGLFAGPRVSKNDERIEAFGTVDELNSILGLVRAHGVDDDIEQELHQIQNDLFSIGARLATIDPKSLDIRLLSDEDVERLEGWIDAHESKLPTLKNFILPGGGVAAATLQHARTVSRRAERRVVSIQQTQGADEYQNIVVFLNRLSDYLFVIGRVINQRQSIHEPIWNGQ